MDGACGLRANPAAQLRSRDGLRSKHRMYAGLTVEEEYDPVD